GAGTGVVSGTGTAHGSGPGSAPVAATARRARKCAQPVACRSARMPGSPLWTRSSRVPVAVAVSVNSTREAPGGRSALPAMPHETTTRRGASTSRYSPRTGTPLMSTVKAPPGVGFRSAYWPIHATIPSAVVRWANTISGGASMSIEVENSAMVPRRPLRCPLQRRQVARPEPVQELPNHGEPVGLHREQVPGALALLGDQTRAAQDP